MDRHDPHGVVVGLGEHRLGDPGALGGLLVDPVEVGAQAAAGGLAPRPGLVDHEPQAAPHVARAALGEPELEGAAVAGDAVEQLGGRLPVAGLVDLEQERQARSTIDAVGGIGRRRACCRTSAARRSTLWRKRSSSPQPSSGVRRALTMRRWSVGSSAARSTISRSRTARVA